MPEVLRIRVIQGLLAVIACIFASFVSGGISAAATGNEQPLSFTVQVGSYESLENAKQVFLEYLGSFPGYSRKLRIESHPNYFVLRVGCFADRESARNLKRRIARLFPKAYTLQAYYIPGRVLRRKTRGKGPARKTFLMFRAELAHKARN